MGGAHNDKLVINQKLYKNDLYLDFVEENPDYAPKSKMTVSRTRFYKWLHAYSEYKFDCVPEEGRDTQGKWLIFKIKTIIEETGELEF